MPIYEYEPLDSQKGCKDCHPRFEIIQAIYEELLIVCPFCGQKVRKIISRCRSEIVEYDESHKAVERKITNYEKASMWSHAAELADKHSQAINKKGMKLRAIEDYKRAGYDSNILDKHITKNET